MENLDISGRFRLRLKGYPLLFKGELDLQSEDSKNQAQGKALFFGPVLIAFVKKNSKEE